MNRYLWKAYQQPKAGQIWVELATGTRHLLGGRSYNGKGWIVLSPKHIDIPDSSFRNKFIYSGYIWKVNYEPLTKKDDHE